MGGVGSGGARIGGGAKRKSLGGKILAGQSAKFIPTNEFAGSTSDIPEPSSYLTDRQSDNEDLEAERIYYNTYKWLRTVGCDKLVSQALIEQYAMLYARYMNCEKHISKNGYTEKAINGAVGQSQYVRMAVEYCKQANTTWAQIYQVVKENASEEYTNKPDDAMEQLLRKKKKA